MAGPAHRQLGCHGSAHPTAGAMYMAVRSRPPAHGPVLVRLAKHQGPLPQGSSKQAEKQRAPGAGLPVAPHPHLSRPRQVRGRPSRPFCCPRRRRARRIADRGGTAAPRLQRSRWTAARRQATGVRLSRETNCRWPPITTDGRERESSAYKFPYNCAKSQCHKEK